MSLRFTKHEHIHAQLALITAIALQVAVLAVSHDLSFGPQYLIISTEIAMAVLLAFTVNVKSMRSVNLQKLAAGVLLAFLSFANISSLVLVLNSLIVTHTAVSGTQLLASAVAIFLTNIIVYALWYWEIDSPGLTHSRWSRNEKDFQFTQQDKPAEHPGWRPEFVDYLYLSVTNAVNFAPADTRPLSRSAKMLMMSQALVSVFTLALVLARSVSILG